MNHNALSHTQYCLLSKLSTPHSAIIHGFAQLIRNWITRNMIHHITDLFFISEWQFLFQRLMLTSPLRSMERAPVTLCWITSPFSKGRYRLESWRSRFAWRADISSLGAFHTADMRPLWPVKKVTGRKDTSMRLRARPAVASTSSWPGSTSSPIRLSRPAAKIPN